MSRLGTKEMNDPSDQSHKEILTFIIIYFVYLCSNVTNWSHIYITSQMSLLPLTIRHLRPHISSTGRTRLSYSPFLVNTRFATSISSASRPRMSSDIDVVRPIKVPIQRIKSDGHSLILNRELYRLSKNPQLIYSPTLLFSTHPLQVSARLARFQT